MGLDVAELKAASIEALARVSSLLLTTEIDAEMQGRGWTPQLAAFIANSMIECRSKIEDGWLPGPDYGTQWARLVLERITRTREIDQLDRGVDEASDAVERLGRAVQAQK